MTSTATLDFCTGTIVINPPLHSTAIPGMAITGITVAPWGEEEFGWERADDALNDLGLRRLAGWTPDEFGESPSCQVELTDITLVTS